MNSESELWDQVWDILGYHAKGQATPQETLLRLIDEQFQVHLRQPIPADLAIEAMKPRREGWTTSDLDKLRRKRERTGVQGDRSQPIVVLRWSGQDFLIDGTRRINERVAQQVEGTHPVIVLSVESG